MLLQSSPGWASLVPPFFMILRRGVLFYWMRLFTIGSLMDYTVPTRDIIISFLLTWYFLPNSFKRALHPVSGQGLGVGVGIMLSTFLCLWSPDCTAVCWCGELRTTGSSCPSPILMQMGTCNCIRGPFYRKGPHADLIPHCGPLQQQWK